MLLAGPQFKTPITIDFREKAPLGSSTKMFLDEQGNEIKGKSINGIFAAGIPGMVDGLLKVHSKYGKLSLDKVMSPAIRLAKNGFKIYPHLANAIQKRLNTLKLFPSSIKKFFGSNNKPLKEGDLLVQKDLAKTLKLIASGGRRAFYEGSIAKAIVATSKKYKGIHTLEDYRSYNSKWRKPIQGKFKGYDVFSMAPPSSGGIHIIQMLNALEHYELGKNYDPFDKRAIHLTASVMQQAFVDRARYLGDSDFVKVPIKELVSKEYAEEMVSKIDIRKARKSKDIFPAQFQIKESNDTTHFTLMASDGTTISSTQTINGLLGSGLVAEGTGIVLNNEMDDFATKVGASNLFGAIGGKNNLVEPQKRPLSSMSPTIVMKDNKAILALGTPNGTRIITCTMLVALNYLEYKLPLYGAVAATRYHHQWYPDEIRVDAPGFSKATMASLKEMGHKISDKPYGCKVQAIANEQGRLHGVSDPRGEGLATGL